MAGSQRRGGVTWSGCRRASHFNPVLVEVNTQHVADHLGHIARRDLVADAVMLEKCAAGDQERIALPLYPNRVGVSKRLLERPETYDPLVGVIEQLHKGWSAESVEGCFVDRDRPLLRD